MISSTKKNKAFTLAEMMIIFAIIGVVAAFIAIIAKTKMDHTKKYWTYAAYTNLSKVVSELIADGCTSTDATLCSSNLKSIPLKAHVNPLPTNIVRDGGLCDRITEKMNLVGNAVCTRAAVPGSTVDFSSIQPDFIASNGSRFYNFSSNPSAVSPPPSNYSLYFLGLYECRDPTVDLWKSTPTAGEWCYHNQSSYSTPRLYTPTELSGLMAFEPALIDPPWSYWSSQSCTEAPSGYIRFFAGFPQCLNGTTTYAMKYYVIQPVQNYTLYIDVDGPRGKSRLNEDVFKFFVLFDGSVYPAIDSTIANDSSLLSVSVKQGTNWLLKGISYREAVCRGNLQKNSSYCDAVTIGAKSYGPYSAHASCPDATSCSIEVLKP